MNTDKTEKIPEELFKKVRKIELHTKKLVNAMSSGGYTSVFRGQGMEFEEVREYSPGDDYRKIDWNVTARHNTPYVKRHREERELTVMLLLDVSGSLNFGSSFQTKRSVLVETAALLAFTSLFNQDKIGSIFFTDRIEQFCYPSKSKNAILRMIRDILFFKPEGKETNINLALDYAVSNMKHRGIIFILSDFLCDIDSSKLFIASRKHDIIPIIIEDNFEFPGKNVGLIDMIDNETGRKMLVDTGSREYKKFLNEQQQRKETFLNELKKYRVEPICINTTESAEKPILTYFHKRKQRH
ncbi:MAG: DUF58 domain-containing protein [Spirochaetales bacterium]|nr:DUF58 domain-containing protein [Spirochaetales bacterium]